MHVAQFVHRYPPALGGAEAWTARLSRSLVATGHRVSVYTTTALDLAAFTDPTGRELPAGTTVEDGVSVHRFRPSFRWPGRRLVLKAMSCVPARSLQTLAVPWAPTSRGLWRAGGDARADVNVVHALAFPYAPVIRAALRLARRRGVPFVITPFLHLGDPDDPRDRIRRAYTAPHLRWLLRQADRVIVQTPTEAAAVGRVGVPSERIIQQGLGVDPTECTGGDRARARQGWGVGPNEVVIGHLANLSSEKGTIDLVRAATELATATPFRLVLAGPAMPSFEQYVGHAGRSNWVTLTGPLGEEAKRDFYAGIDLFVLPSRSDSFGLVFLEAWASGIPVIAYRAGGVVDVVRHEVDGLLVKCGDLRGLAVAIGRLVENRTERQAWGRAGRDRLASDFQWTDKLHVAAVALTRWP
jgi:glycosyltransferase involved in cell wall biosynthesis